MKLDHHQLLVSVGISFLTLIFFSFFVLFSFFMIPRREGENIEEHQMYQYFQKNHISNQSTFGVLSLPIIIEREFAFHNGGEFSQLISRIGTQEYECLGSCYCEPSGYRRSAISGSLLARGIAFFLVSVTTYAAYDLAKEYFKEECIEKYSNQCDMDSIVSDVEECHPITIENNDSEAIKEYDDEEYDDEDRIFFCYGNCIPSKKITLPESKKLLEDFRCERLKQEGKVRVTRGELNVKAKQQFVQLARVKFQTFFLKKFCRSESQVRMDYLGRQVKRGKEYVNRLHYTATLCVGYDSTKSQTSHVQCRQIDPPSTEYNRKWRNRVWWEKKNEWDKIH